jgi:hypothetical protein
MQYRKTSIADPGPTVLYIYAVFNGSTSTFFYPTDWTHNGKDICIEGARPSSKFSCNRTLLGNCTFSANLYIYGYSSRDSGNYTVQAIGSGVASRNATICVDIFSESQVRSHSSERQYRPSAGYTVSTALSKQKQKSTGDRYRYLDVCAVGVALLLMVTTVSLSLVYFFKPAIHAYKEKSSETFPGFSPYLQSGSDIHKDFVLPNRTVECDNLEKKLSHVSKVIGPQSPKLVHGLGLSDRHSYPTEIEQLKFEVLLRWQLGPSSRNFTVHVPSSTTASPLSSGSITSPGSPDSRQEELDLFQVTTKLITVAEKWRSIGLALGLKECQLTAIHSQSSNLDVSDYLREMLSRWLLKKAYDVKKHGEPSWLKLSEAVRHPAGGNSPSVADSLYNKQ